MTVLQTIFDSERVNQPLFIEDFVDDSSTYNSVKTTLSNYVKSGDIKRYCQGVYYVPSKTILGDSTLPFESVIERKYIRDRERVFGYYSAMTLMNLVGLSTQVPNIPEITTNNEATRKRKVKINKRFVVVRRSPVEITAENALYLQFLDIFRYASIETIKENKEKVLAFFDQNSLSFDMLQQTEKTVSMKLRKALRRSGIYDELAYR